MHLVKIKRHKNTSYVCLVHIPNIYKLLWSSRSDRNPWFAPAFKSHQFFMQQDSLLFRIIFTNATWYWGNLWIVYRIRRLTQDKKTYSVTSCLDFPPPFNNKRWSSSRARRPAWVEQIQWVMCIKPGIQWVMCIKPDSRLSYESKIFFFLRM